MYTPWILFKNTLKECCTNLACAPFFLFAALFYSLYYCWPYMAQLPEHIKVAVVDEDKSPLSRRLLMELDSAVRLDVVLVTHNREKAIEAMKKGMAASIIGIPENYEKNILNNIPTALTLIGNGAFIVKARSSIAGLEGPLEQAASEAITAHLIQYGIPYGLLAQKKLQSPTLVTQFMYNTLGGYLNFVGPIVFIIIFQTLMVCGTGMLLNSWFSQPEEPEQFKNLSRSPWYLFSLQAPVILICMFWVIFIEGCAFALHGINSFQNIPSTMLAGLLFSFSIGSLAIFVGFLFKRYKFIIQAVVTSSIPCVFITGNIFPTQNIPIYMRLLSWFFPSTPGSTAIVRTSQAGANIHEVAPYLLHLVILWLMYSLFSWITWKKLHKRSKEHFV